MEICSHELTCTREAAATLKMVEGSVLVAQQLELLLYGYVLERIPEQLFTDCESTLESVASLKQISTKTLRMTIVDLKERLLKGEISLYDWLPTEMMWTNILTKEMKLPQNLEDELVKNVMVL